MKKTGYIHLLLLSAAFSSCRTTAYQQSGCPAPSATDTSGMYCYNDSAACAALQQSYINVMQSIFQGICYPLNPGASANYKVKFLHDLPRKARSHFIVRGGFGISSKTASS